MKPETYCMHNKTKRPRTIKSNNMCIRIAGKFELFWGGQLKYAIASRLQNTLRQVFNSRRVFYQKRRYISTGSEAYVVLIRGPKMISQLRISLLRSHYFVTELLTSRQYIRLAGICISPELTLLPKYDTDIMLLQIATDRLA